MPKLFTFPVVLLFVLGAYSWIEAQCKTHQEDEDVLTLPTSSYHSPSVFPYSPASWYQLISL